MNLRTLFRAALPVLVLAAGAVSIHASSGRAEAEPRPGAEARPWRSVLAPAEAVALSDYLSRASDLQPPGGGEGDGSPDTGTQIEHPIPQGGSSQGGNPPVTTQPGGGTVPDSVKNSLWNRAREESLRAVIPGMRSNTQETAAPPPGARRGVLGLHPMFILVGLIALNIFVVTVAGK